MGIKPKYDIGEFVVDSKLVNKSESIVRIISRKPILEDLKFDWIYFGHEYLIEGYPFIKLKYKTTITARESRFAPLTSRIS